MYDSYSPFLNVLIDGGKDNDYITSRAKNTTLDGGDGHDTITSTGNEVSISGGAGDGKDVIYGFDNSDTLTLDGIDFTSASYKKSSKAVTLKFDEGSITFKDFTATTFHINDDIYKISGTKLVKK